MLIRIALVIVVLCPACARTIDSTIADAQLTAAVKTALLNDPSIDGTLVTVRSAQGVVILEGTLPTAEAATNVVSIVRQVTGVRGVESRIGIETSAAATVDR